MTAITSPAPASLPSRKDRPARRRVAVAAATGSLIVALFQITLILGAPFGAAAFGGANAGQLPQEWRIASAVSACVWLLAALIVLARGGLAIAPLPKAVSRWGTWVVVGFLALGTVLNLASSSPWERFGWAPFALTLMILCIILARGGSGSRKPSP